MAGVKSDAYNKIVATSILTSNAKTLARENDPEQVSQEELPVVRSMQNTFM